MENRRQHFRYPFTPKSSWKASFRAMDAATSFSAEIVNLSIGGLSVKLEPGHTAKGERWIVAIELATHTKPLQIPAEQVQPNAAEPGIWGFRFLPLANALDQEEQDRLIWRFILEEQRRDRRVAIESMWWSA